jgi:hypothetical protein
MSACIVLSAVLAVSILTKADFDSPAFATSLSPKVHLEEGIKAMSSQGHTYQIANQLYHGEHLFE